MKEFFANYNFQCDNCSNDIDKGMQFYFFNDDKICETCWGKLVIYYDEI